MKNIIIVGDSFAEMATGWPNQLAALLGLNPVVVAQGAGSWWSIRDKLDDLDYRLIADAEYMIFVHPPSERLNTTDEELLRVNKDAQDKDERESAVHLHYKYVYNDEFARWAHRAWIKELQYRFSDKKIIHLHSFPSTNHLTTVLKGMTVEPNLAGISLCEMGKKNLEFFVDIRPNHFNDHNNTVLAEELARLIRNYQTGPAPLNTDLFELRTDRWLKWRY
jgi:hypothetical protein